MEKLTLNLPVLLPDIPSESDQCVTRLIEDLKARDGVLEAHIKAGKDDNPPELCIHFDPDVITLHRIKQLAQQTGAELHDTYGHLLLETKGIRHTRHARSISERLRNTEGIIDAYAGASGWLRIEFNRMDIDEHLIRNVLEEMNLDIGTQIDGYFQDSDRTKQMDQSILESTGKLQESDGSAKQTHQTEHEHEDHTESDHDGHDHGGIFGEKTELIFSLIGGALLGLGFGLSFIPSLGYWIPLALYASSYFFGAYYLVQEAYTEVKACNFEIDFLMLVAAVGAAILGEWAEGALLLFLFSLGHSLEHYAMGRARDAIKDLAELAPKTALRKANGQLEEISVENLEIGDVIVIKPNSKISADGVIVNGQSNVNQAPITGESVPVDKKEYTDMETIREDPESIDDEHRVFAGTINGSGSLEVKVTKLSKDSTLSRLITMVNEAEAQKSPTQQFTDKFERYFVPAVLALVVLLNFAFLVVDETFADSFYRAMAVLVAASPCALAISTPSAVLSGVARAARAGVLIKGGRPLENLGILKALAFDKTGTLTEGKPKVTDIIPYQDSTESELLQTAVAVETLSDHPLANAVVRDGKNRLDGADIPDAEDLESVTGRGVKAKLGASIVHIGNLELFTESAQIQMPDDLREQVQSLEADGKTTMIVRKGECYLGFISLMDTPRDGAQSVIQQLRNIGMEHLIMLTGDNQRVANAVAGQIGIDDPKGNLLPEDKVKAIKQLRSDENHVAMVGDGVNDAPAMANSTVGIAMGAAGSDVALETADVALLADKLSVLPFAIGLSRKTKSIIKQNLWISLGMVALLVPATILGLSMGFAVIGHEGSTVVVVFNALRLLAYKA